MPTRRSRSRKNTLTEPAARAAPYTVRNWANARSGIPGTHDHDGTKPYQSKSSAMTGTDSRKWIASFSTLLATRTFRGKRTFLMREALPRELSRDEEERKRIVGDIKAEEDPQGYVIDGSEEERVRHRPRVSERAVLVADFHLLLHEDEDQIREVEQ